LRSNVSSRLAALEAQRDQILQARYDLLFARERVIVGEDVAHEMDRLASAYHRHEISEAEYNAAVEPLIEPFRVQIDTDPEVMAIWPALARADWYKDYVARHVLRKPPNED
jgi:hypothetical protein